MRKLLIILALLGLCGGARAQAAKQPDTLIRNATVLTASRGRLDNTDILLSNGKIAKIGKGLQPTPNARVIEATGKYVIPGIFDAHSHTMIDGGVNECTKIVTAMARIEDVLNPRDINLYRALAGGTTALNILHGSCNSIGGQNAVVKVKYGHPLEDFFFGAMPGIKFALGENPKRTNQPAQPGQPRRYPATRMGVEVTIREAFTKARDYKAAWDEYNAAKRRGDNVLPPKKDVTLDPLVEILEGKRFVHAHCYRADEILMLINLADEFGFKIRTFQHALEGYKVAKEIARHGGGASIFIDFWGYKNEAYDAIPGAPEILTRAGVVVSLNSDSDERARRLNLDAAKAMRYGNLTEEEALRMVTLNPAKQFGVDNRLGSIDEGKDADLSIWNAHPFSVYARVEKTFVDGEILFDRELDLQRRGQVAKEREMLEKMDANKPGAASPPAPAPRRPAGYSREHEEREGGGN
jgi:imidazolonepropionase-like amidohydrolase